MVPNDGPKKLNGTSTEEAAEGKAFGAYVDNVLNDIFATELV